MLVLSDLQSRIADGLQATSCHFNMSLAPLRLGLANQRVPFSHQSDQRNTLGDLRESLLLRLLRWFGDMVTGQLIMNVHYALAAVPHCHWQLSDAMTIRAMT